MLDHSCLVLISDITQTDALTIKLDQPVGLLVGPE